MVPWLKRHRGVTVALLACSVLLVGSLAAPAFGAPSALSIAKRALKTSKRALKTSKKANKRSKRAVRKANQALKEAGQPGPRGPAGATGLTGARGPGGFGVLRYGFDGVEAVPNTTTDSLLAECPPGTFPTGGDAGANDSASGADKPAVILQQAIAFDENGPFGYYADYDNETGADVDVFADVVCAN